MLITTFAEVVEKPFMATEFVLNIQSWLATSCYCVGTIWKTKDFWNHVLKVKHFDRATYSGFTIREFRTKGDY